MKEENLNENRIQVMLIDPFDQSLSYVELSDSNIQDYYKVMDCRCFDIVRLGGGVIMYVDDEGLLRNNNRYFRLGSGNYAGKAILARETKDGGTTDVNLFMTEVADKLSWLPEGHSEEPYMEFHSIN